MSKPTVATNETESKEAAADSGRRPAPPPEPVVTIPAAEYECILRASHKALRDLCHAAGVLARHGDLVDATELHFAMGEAAYVDVRLHDFAPAGVSK